MKILRRRVRKAFLGTSLVLAYYVFVLVKHPEWAELHGEVRYYGLLTVCVLLAVLYTAAFHTTSEPSPYRNNWAVAASSLSIVLGFFQAYFYRSRTDNLRAELGSLVAILMGSAGLYLYAPGGSPPEPESAVQPAAPVRPIQSIQPAPAAASLPPRKISTTPTPLAPSLAAASSPELAAAAASPGDPNAQWDPLAFIRTPETLQKVRS
jgi:hypothetical protein